MEQDQDVPFARGELCTAPGTRKHKFTIHIQGLGMGEYEVTCSHVRLPE
jgi:hypothetical protein